MIIIITFLVLKAFVIIIMKIIIPRTLIVMLIIMTITILIIITFLMNVLQLTKNIDNIDPDKTKDSINDTNVTIRRKKPNDNNNNNNNEINSSNRNNTINKDNVTSPSQSQNSKETVFILGDSMVKKINGFLLTRKLKHKSLVKVRPFSSAKSDESMIM